ncbi:MAG: hypothetical protein CSA94_02070, partial [Bacteroidetes bacterium]
MGFSQNNKRQLLRNEIGAKERIQAHKDISAYHYGNNHDVFQTPYWGNSQVFLKIAEQGYFTVEIDRQMMSNPYGKYRFFEVSSGLNRLSIYKGGFLIYRAGISVPRNSRIVLYLSENGLYLLDVYPIRNEYDIWSGDVWNDDYNDIGYGTVMSPQQFMLFKEQLAQTASFDKEKIEFIDMQISAGTQFSALQIKQLLHLFDFDSKRLKAAKRLYFNCVDPGNFYRVLD